MNATAGDWIYSKWRLVTASLSLGLELCTVPTQSEIMDCPILPALAAVIASPRLEASSKGPLLSLSVLWRPDRSGWAGSIENCVGWHNHPRFIKWFVE